jgi:uncharacterized membrane protein
MSDQVNVNTGGGGGGAGTVVAVLLVLLVAAVLVWAIAFGGLGGGTTAGTAPAKGGDTTINVSPKVDVQAPAPAAPAKP